MSPAIARTSAAAIVAAARALLEEGGLDAVSMAAVAQRVGVRAPSLYKHHPDRDALIAAVATAVAEELGAELHAALRDAGPDATAHARLRALAHAYRDFARRAPRATSLLFAATTPRTAPRVEVLATAAQPVLNVAGDLAGPEHALSAARVVTAFVHGFTSMETAGAFRLGGEVDAAFELGVDTLVAGLDRRTG